MCISPERDTHLVGLARYLAIARLSFVVRKHFMLCFFKSEHRCYIIFMCQRAPFYRHPFWRFLGVINLRGGKPCSGIADIRHRSYRYKLHYLEPFYSDFGLWSHGRAWQTVHANRRWSSGRHLLISQFSTSEAVMIAISLCHSLSTFYI